MDYEKAYKEALERAKGLIDFCSDSELKTLENVFPELAESEDEKIRKELLNYLYDVHDDDEDRARWLAWLEKQGEHAKFRESIQIGDEVTRNKDGMLVNLSQLKRVAKPNESKQGEQKAMYHDVCDKCVRQPTCQSDCFLQQCKQNPAENKGMNLVEEEMTPFQKKVFCIIDTTIEEEQGLKQVCDELLRLAHDEIMQTPAAWTEEDEKQARQIERIVHNDGCTQKLQKQIADWLESLKGRVGCEVNCTTTKECNEEVEAAISLLKDIADEQEKDYCPHNANDLRKAAQYLETCRLQNTWKPSDEQMKALWEVYKGGEEQAALASLYSDLKKLKD